MINSLEKLNYIFCDPGEPGFLWQQEVYIVNLLDLGVNPDNIFALSTKTGSSYIDYLKEEFPNIHVLTFEDNRNRAGITYSASIKPYLMNKFSINYSQYLDRLFYYTDSDIMLKHIPIIPKNINQFNWYGSERSFHQNYDYFKKIDQDHHGILNKLCQISGINIDWLKSINHRTIGAQYFMTGFTSKYWEDVYQTSLRLKAYLDTLPNQVAIERWLPEMWATLWMMYRYKINPHVDPHGNFAYGNWTNKAYDKVNIFHNAGVNKNVGINKHLFNKWDYRVKPPYYDIDRLLKWVNQDSFSKIYLEQIKRTSQVIKHL